MGATVAMTDTSTAVATLASAGLLLSILLQDRLNGLLLALRLIRP